MKSSHSRRVRVPVMGVHKASGQARVVIDGTSFYLGKPGAEAEQRYRRLVGGWLETGHLKGGPVSGDSVAVADVVAAFLEGHETYYVGPDSRQTGELGNYRQAFGVLLERFAVLPADEFSPRRLKELQGSMIERGWCRTVINDQIRRLKRTFRGACVPHRVRGAASCGWVATFPIKGEGVGRYPTGSGAGRREGNRSHAATSGRDGSATATVRDASVGGSLDARLGD